MKKENTFCRVTVLIAVAVSLMLSIPARAGGFPEYRPAPARTETSVQRLMEPGVNLFDLSVGYNYMHLDDAFPETEHLHGVDASAFVNVTSWLGLGGDFMANFGERSVSGVDVDSQRYIYVFGPRITVWRNNQMRLFVEALAGGVHAKVDVDAFRVNVSDDGFAGAAGGGLDWRLNDQWSLRLIQADYLPTNLGDQWQHNFRASTGIVFSFGPRR